jgi:tetratricopeptide (TPR) repeat protein
VRPNRTEAIPLSRSATATRQPWDLLRRVGWSGLNLTAIMVLSAAAALPAPVEDTRVTVIKIVAQVQKADYEGDRVALQQLYANLEPFTADEKLASRVRYWRGFALWRRAINGFNDSADPKDLERDLTQAIAEFKESAAKDPAFVDALAGTISCLGNLVYLSQGNAARVQELIAQSSPLVKAAKSADPENPRLLWVLGPILWNVPPERGGGQDKAMEGYQKGLQAERKLKGAHNDPLDPSWGEPELLMNLAWANLHQTTPDLKAAEEYAELALELVPYWHYVRDILMPQIRNAKGTR